MKRAACLICIFVSILASQISAETWYVKPDGTGQVISIQAAVDSCHSGDTILVAAGTYRGIGNRNIEITEKSIVVRSEQGAASTIIDCEGSWESRGFNISHSGMVTLDGITITKGSTRGAGAVACLASTLAIRNSVIRNNESANLVGGIQCDSSTVYVYDSSIRNNDGIWGDAGGIYSKDGYLEMSNDSICNNIVREGVGGICCWRSDAVIVDNVIIDNSGGLGGPGGISFGSNYSGVIAHNVISGNYSRFGGGGVSCYSSSSVSIYENVISNNSTSHSGGGISCGGPAIEIYNNTISDNYACEGGGIDIHGAGSPRVEGNVIFNNEAGHCPIGKVNNGPLYCDGDGGGLSISYGSSPLIKGNTIEGNSSCRAGGIFIYQSTPRIENCIVANNPAAYLEDAGGIRYIGSAPIPSISCCDVYNNQPVNYVGMPDQTGLNGNISVDPRFCNPASGAFTLRTDSPCLPGNHPDGAACGLIGALGWGCPAPAPYISAIVDVKNDQGRQVSVSWQRSSWDTIGSAKPILTYEVYRRIDTLPARSRALTDGGLLEDARKRHPNLAYPPGDWHYLFEVPAHGENIYHAVAPTLEDSCVYNSTYPDYLSTYFVRATTAVPTTYFDSNPDSGYSVDNLSPLPPQELAITRNNVLQWEESGEKDLAGYNIYAKESLESANATLIGAVTLSEFDISQSIRAGYHHWGVTARDYNGNEGDIGLVEWVPTGDDPIAPSVYSLMQNFPNPFNPTTMIQFDLPEKTKVTLSVFNANGQLVRVIVNKTMGAGRWQFDWDGKDSQGMKVSSGIYFYRLATSKYNESKKMILIR